MERDFGVPRVLKRLRFPDQETSEEWWDQIEEERNLVAGEGDSESKDGKAPRNPAPEEVHPDEEVLKGEQPPMHHEQQGEEEEEEQEHKVEEPPHEPRARGSSIA